MDSEEGRLLEIYFTHIYFKEKPADVFSGLAK